MKKIYPFIKRLVDFFVALVGLVVLSPLFLVIAILIKLDSSGPVIYSQKRVTIGRKVFTTYKFRSMVKNARKLELEKGIAKEKLVTKFGKLLRHSHFDEFPQLINVIKGEMSLVGPRPLIAENEIRRLMEDKERAKRYEVKVGMASLERIINLAPGKREKIFSIFSNKDELKRCKEDIEYDYYYVENQSFFVDFILFTETFLMSIKKLIGAKVN